LTSSVATAAADPAAPPELTHPPCFISARGFDLWVSLQVYQGKPNACPCTDCPPVHEARMRAVGRCQRALVQAQFVYNRTAAPDAAPRPREAADARG